MLTRVQIKNFKSIGEGPNGTPGVDIALKPLTFLVGPNGGGKSSILEAIVSVLDVALLQREGTQTDRRHKSFGSRAAVSAISEPDIQWEGERPHNLYLLRSTRGYVRRNEGPYGTSWVGPQGEHILPFLNQMNAAGYRKSKESFDKWMGEFGIRNPSSALSEGTSNTIEGTGQDNALSVEVNLSQASSGGRQALIVLAQVVFSPEDSLILIEEPEISLHPEAQVEMCRFLAAHAARGKQIIATTHSPFMLLALQYPIQEYRESNGQRGISPEQVAVYEVERDKKSGVTVARPLPISKDGYLKNWVPSFSKVEKKLLRDWLKTLPEA